MLATAPSNQALEILLAEDNGGDVCLIERALRQSAAPCRVHVLDNGVRALAFLRREDEYSDAPRPDVVILDLNLPRKGGLEVLSEVKRDPELRRIPVVVLSSSRAEADVARAYESQATAYFVKPVSDYRTVVELIVRFVFAAERPAATVAALARVDQANDVLAPRVSTSLSALSRTRLLSTIVECAADAIMSMDLGGTITSWNAAAERLFGYTASEALGKPITEIVPDERLRWNEPSAASSAAPLTTFDSVRVDRSGKQRAVSLTLSALVDAHGGLIGLAAIARDVTERARHEEKFRLAVEAAPVATVMADQAGTILLVNAATERLFGYARTELEGQAIDMLVPVRYRAAHPAHRGAFLQRPESRAMGAGREVFGLRRDGVEVPIEIALNPIMTDDGLVVLSSIVDISEHKQAEERFRAAVMSSPHGMVMVNTRGEMVLVNEETERMFGYARDELLGASIEQLVPPRFRAEHPAHRASFLMKPQRRSMGAGRDLYGMRKNGSEFPVEIGLNPISTHQGLFTLSSIVDITERKHGQEVLLARTKELLRSNAELEQFAYVASHDLQEPLRMVASYTRLLAEEYAAQLGKEGQLFVHFARDGAERMQQLIHDLLAYSRIGSRGQQSVSVSAQACLDSALENVRISLEETDCVVRAIGLPSVVTDPVQLAELFQNLISNAIKFRGDQPPLIEVSCEPGVASFQFAVRDNGIGMERQYFEEVFQVFKRLHSKEEYPGTGIGLAICKRIVERSGGRIWIESTLGQGSTFYFTLPREPPKA
jgi:PAS domain S-box-containing protein